MWLLRSQCVTSHEPHCSLPPANRTITLVFPWRRNTILTSLMSLSRPTHRQVDMFYLLREIHKINNTKPNECVFTDSERRQWSGCRDGTVSVSLWSAASSVLGSRFSHSLWLRHSLECRLYVFTEESTEYAHTPWLKSGNIIAEFDTKIRVIVSWVVPNNKVSVCPWPLSLDLLLLLLLLFRLGGLCPLGPITSCLHVQRSVIRFTVDWSDAVVDAAVVVFPSHLLIAGFVSPGWQMCVATHRVGISVGLCKRIGVTCWDRQVITYEGPSPWWLRSR